MCLCGRGVVQCAPLPTRSQRYPGLYLLLSPFYSHPFHSPEHICKYVSSFQAEFYSLTPCHRNLSHLSLVHSSVFLDPSCSLPTIWLKLSVVGEDDEREKSIFQFQKTNEERSNLSANGWLRSSEKQFNCSQFDGSWKSNVYSEIIAQISRTPKLVWLGTLSVRQSIRRYTYRSVRHMRSFFVPYVYKSIIGEI